MKHRLLIVIITVFCGVVCAYSDDKVDVIYTYIAPDNVSLEIAKQTAIDRAKIQAIEEKYGSKVSQSNTSLIVTDDNDSSSEFISYGGSQIKGEWIETIGDPKFDIRYENGMLFVNVHLNGIVREKPFDDIAVIVELMCNGITHKHKRTEFKNGDDIYVSFESSDDGFVSIFLSCYNEKTVYRLLPYIAYNDDWVPVEKKQRYVFFDPDATNVVDSNKVDEFIVTTESQVERNDLIVVFTKYEKKCDIDWISPEMGPKNCSWIEFSNWFAKFRKDNDDIVVSEIPILISK